MNDFIQLKKAGAAVIGALALLGSAPVMADTIDFDALDSNTFNGLDTFDAGDYHFAVIDSPVAGPSGTGFAGAIGNGNDPYLCAIAACPSGNSSMFYLGVNDGSVNISRGDSKAFKLGALDYAFLAPVDNLPGYSYGALTVTATTVGGSTVTYAFDFPALAGGSSPFLTADLSSKFGSTAYSNVTISSCIFTDDGCVNPFDNKAQFAIDNLTLAPVPEPQTYAMLGLGLAAISLVSRRRANQNKHA